LARSADAVLSHSKARYLIPFERVAARAVCEINTGAEGFRLIAPSGIQPGQAIAGDPISRAANQNRVEQPFGTFVPLEFAIAESVE
jgi:hypothetical protein